LGFACLNGEIGPKPNAIPFMDSVLNLRLKITNYSEQEKFKNTIAICYIGLMGYYDIFRRWQVSVRTSKHNRTIGLRGWGRCLKVTLQTHALEYFRSFSWGMSRGSSVRRTGSKDPHRRELKFDKFFVGSWGVYAE
jgi:hypothetical protein